MSVFTVSQVARYLREMLEEDSLLADIWISGEVSNITRAQSGHAYFTFKDADSQLRCVMFRGNSGSELLSQGSLVVAHGRMSFYEPRGTVDFISDIIMPEGTGPLHLELEKLRVRLETEGLFDPSRKRPLPRFPKVVGVVTSPIGAAIHDIRKVIERRYPLVELLLAPTQVQGDEAAAGIVAALRALNEDARADVIVVTRGGGSIEELWPFNEEAVARAIYASAIPVVSAVGHERDFTIADLVADVRAPTPSVAAETVVPDAVSLRHEVFTARDMAYNAIVTQLMNYHYELDGLVLRLRRGAPDTDAWRRRTDELTQTASRALAAHLNLVQERLHGLEARLKSLNPQAILGRGYAVVEKEESRRVVSSVGQVNPGDALNITVSDGSIPATTGGRAATKRPSRRVPVQAGERLL